MRGVGRTFISVSVSFACALLLGLPAAASIRATPLPAPEPVWVHIVPMQGELRSVATDGAGDAYATGRAYRSTAGGFAFLKKYAPDGTLIWSRLWRPGVEGWWGANTEGVDVAIGPDGSAYVAARRFPKFGEGAAGYILKYSPDGDLIWHVATEGWEKGDAEELTAVAVGSDRLAVAGNAYQCCGGLYEDGWVRVYDLDGNLLWKNMFEFPGLRRTNDFAAGVSVDAVGAVYAAGWFATGRETTSSTTGEEPIVQKLSPSGDVEWTWTLSDGNPDDFDLATSIDVRGDVLAVTGFLDETWTISHCRPGHAWLGRFNLDGALLWSATWGAGRYNTADPASVSVDSDGSLLVAGTQHEGSDGGSNAFVRKYDGDGILQWRIVLQVARYLYGAHVDADTSTFYVTGYRDWNARGWLWAFEG